MLTHSLLTVCRLQNLLAAQLRVLALDHSGLLYLPQYSFHSDNVFGFNWASGLDRTEKLAESTHRTCLSNQAMGLFLYKQPLLVPLVSLALRSPIPSASLSVCGSCVVNWAVQIKKKKKVKWGFKVNCLMWFTVFKMLYRKEKKW